MKALGSARQSADLAQGQVAKHLGSHTTFKSKIGPGERTLDAAELADFCRIYRLRLRRFLKEARLEGGVPLIAARSHECKTLYSCLGLPRDSKEARHRFVSQIANDSSE